MIKKTSSILLASFSVKFDPKIMKLLSKNKYFSMWVEATLKKLIKPKLRYTVVYVSSTLQETIFSIWCFLSQTTNAQWSLFPSKS